MCAYLLVLEAQHDDIQSLETQIASSDIADVSAGLAEMELLWEKAHVLGELVNAVPVPEAPPQTKAAADCVTTLTRALGRLETLSAQFENSILPEIVKAMMYDLGGMSEGLGQFWELCEPVSALLTTAAGGSSATVTSDFMQACERLRGGYDQVMGQADRDRTSGGPGTPWDHVVSGLDGLFHRMHESIKDVAALTEAAEGKLPFAWAGIKLEGPPGNGSTSMRGFNRDLLFLKQLATMRSVLWACHHYAAA